MENKTKSLLNSIAKTTGRLLLLAVRGLWYATKQWILPALFVLLLTLWQWLRDRAIPVIYAGYLKLPRRRLMLGSFLLILALGTYAMIRLEDDKQTFGNAHTIPLMPGEKIHTPQEAVVEQVLSGDWTQQQDATAFIAHGMDWFVADRDRAAGPDDEAYLIEPELKLLAHDAGNKTYGGRLTLEQVAFMLSDMEFPFDPSRPAAESMRQGVTHWVQAALKNPDAPGAYAPQLLYEMGFQQYPAVDLSSDNWDASDYRLTYLELHVFLSAFLQGAAEEDSSVFWGEWQLGKKVYAADEPSYCTYAKNWYIDKGSISTNQVPDKLGNEMINILVSELTGKGVELLGDVVGKALQAVSAAFKVLKLGMLYWSVDIHVVPSVSNVHKPSPSEAGKDVAFRSVVGVDEKKYKEYLDSWRNSPTAKNVKDCMSFFGLPSPTDADDIAADVENWGVEWRLYGGHATFGLDKNDFYLPAQLQMNVKRTGPAQGETKFIVDVNKEDVRSHEGEEKQGQISVQAELEMDSPPLIGPYLNGAKKGNDVAKGEANGKSLGFFDFLGIADTLAEVAIGWFEQLVPPKAYGIVTVDFHKHKFPQYSYEGYLKATKTLHVSETGPYMISFNRLDMTAMMNSTSVLVSTVSTTSMSEVPSQNRASWSLKGETSMHLGYQHALNATGNLSCIGGSVATTVKQFGSGSGSSSEEAVASIVRTGSEKEGYVFQIITRGSSATAYFNSTEQRVDTANGCEFARSNTIVETYENQNDDIIDTLEAEFRTNESYPETITGSKQTKDINGSTTTWTWKLFRIEPSQEPTFKMTDGSVGGG